MKIVLIALPGPEGESSARRLGPRLPLESLRLEAAASVDADLYWIHRGPEETCDPHGFPVEVAAALGERIERGARLLLTGPAALLVGVLGLEEELPELGPVHGGRARPGPRGVLPFLDHPLFRRFPGGVLLRELEPGSGGQAALYPRGRSPLRGILTGVEKTEGGCDPGRGILFEHRRGRGRILSLGAHLAFAREDAFEEHRLRFAGDLVDYLMDDARCARTIPWPTSPPAIRILHEDFDEPPPEEQERPAATSRDEIVVPEANTYFDLVASSGLVCAGHAKSGIEGVWLMAVRVLARMKTAFLTADGRRFGEGDPGVLVALTRREDHVERRFALGPTQVTQRISLVQQGAGIAIEWRNHGPFDLRLEIEAVADQRLSEPYPEGILSPLDLRSGPGERSLSWSDVPTGTAVTFLVDPAPEDASLHDLSDATASRFSFVRRLLLPAGRSATVHLLAGPRGRDVPERAPELTGARRLLRLSLGDSEAEEAIRWVLRGLAALCVATRTGRNGVLAGIGPEGPSYGGAEALWATRALIPFGFREETSQLLRLLSENLDATGRVFERMTAAGVPSFGSPEASLLFVEAVERRLAWTGDADAARALWPAVRRVMRSCEGLAGEPSLVQGTGGPGIDLVTCALLARALGSAARLATLQGETDLAKAWAERAARVVEILDHTFLDASAGRYAHALRGDGSVDLAKSASGAVPVLLSLCPEELCARVVEPFARSEFTVPGGVGFLSTEDPAHDPTGAWTGAATPLVTGWVASAEFAAGRPDVAFQRIAQLLRAAMERGGLLPAVIPGEPSLAPQPPASEEHAAAAHAAALSALAGGLLGAGPGEEAGTFVLAPCLPGGIDRLAFSGLWFLDHEIDGEVSRGATGAGLVVTLRKKDARPLVVQLEPFFPDPCEVREVRGPGGSLSFDTRRVGEGIRASTRIALAESAEVFFAALPDLLVATAALRLSGSAFRIVSRIVEDPDVVQLELEARQGEHELPVRFPARPPARVEGGELGKGFVRFRVDRDGGGSVRLRFHFAGDAATPKSEAVVGAERAAAVEPAAEVADVAEDAKEEESAAGAREPPAEVPPLPLAPAAEVGEAHGFEEPPPDPELVKPPAIQELEELPELEEWTEPVVEAPLRVVPRRARPAKIVVQSIERAEEIVQAEEIVPSRAERRRKITRQLVPALVILALGLGWAAFVLFGPESDVVARGSAPATRAAGVPETRGAAVVESRSAVIAESRSALPVRPLDTRDLLRTCTLQGLRIEDLVLIFGPPFAGTPPDAVHYEFRVPVASRLLVWSGEGGEVYAAEVLGE